MTPPGLNHALKPCIAELIRTRHCPASIVLHVVSIRAEVVKPGPSSLRAFRLALTDGVHSIQGTRPEPLPLKLIEDSLADLNATSAVLKAETHRFVVTGEITEGCHVKLQEYQLLEASRANGKGTIIFLGVSNFQAVGRCSTLSPTCLPHKRSRSETEARRLDQIKDPPAKRRKRIPDRTRGHTDPQGQLRVAKSAATTSSTDIPDVRRSQDTESEDGNGSSSIAQTRCATKSSKARPHQGPDARSEVNGLENIQYAPRAKRADGMSKACAAPPRPEFTEKATISPTPCLNGAVGEATSSLDDNNQATAKQHEPCQLALVTPERQNSTSAQLIPPEVYGTFTSNAPEPPLKLLSLAGLAKLKDRKAKRCDVVATIKSVSSDTVCRGSMGVKRDLVLIDDTTDKEVCLSVWVDAQSFRPDPGTTALFRHLTTHDFRGGSLNAYRQHCEGREWFIPWPLDSGGGELEEGSRDPHFCEAPGGLVSDRPYPEARTQGLTVEDLDFLESALKDIVNEEGIE
ncbi:MAG: hypothetical protein M1833_001189 [Piccolia ochrophora]|nr:MAG: hypothetical protein M1833_001189 [Piccolia ochrophora]